MKMKEKLEQLRQEGLELIKGLSDLDQLEKVRVEFLGKKGKLTKILRGMGGLPPEERPVIGKLSNEVKEEINTELQKQKEALEKRALEKRLQEEAIDVTLPGHQFLKGNLHPLTRTLREVKEIFLGMGFQVATGPEVETEYYNFQALNIPPNHPARDLQDTFYIDDERLLRTHTSPVQIRTMEKEELPIRIIAPGRVYRVDEMDASHSPVFHQVEGLVIDRNISFSDLKGVLLLMVHRLYGEDSRLRFRPSYFPFTEPSAEVDLSCFNCGGEGCRVCSNTGWIELGGSGMVHPNVLRMAGIDPEEYSGFAFGIGLDRLAMINYDISNMRYLYENDKRFLEQL